MREVPSNVSVRVRYVDRLFNDNVSGDDGSLFNDGVPRTLFVYFFPTSVGFRVAILFLEFSDRGFFKFIVLFARQPIALLLSIMLLLEDLFASAVLHSLKLVPFLEVKLSIGLCFAFEAVDLFLLPHQFLSFFFCKLTGADSATDALFLDFLAFVHAVSK